MWILLLLLALMPLQSVSTSAQSMAADFSQPAGWDSKIKLKEAVDLNPDPDILEIRLEARLAKVQIGNGREIEAWTYDGGLPGPLIRLNVGTRLIVHFTNNLPDNTTIHWHGVRVPFEMDGVPGITQPDIKPGESFTYDFKVPDAGLFWYHPHVSSAMQVGNGLYGALLVEDPNEKVPKMEQLTLVLSDVGVADDGSLMAPDAGGTLGMAFGREGNIQLANGRSDGVLVARPGVWQRWRVVNTAKTRYFRLALGRGTTFTRIGGDGGLQEFPTTHSSLVLAPGERADVLVKPLKPEEDEVEALNALFDRGYGSVEYRPVDTLFRVVAGGAPVANPVELPRIGRDIPLLPKESATPVRIEFNLTQDPNTAAFEYNINGQPFWKATPLTARIGETQRWTIVNTTIFSHPLHLHGYFFQVLDENGDIAHPVAWKDTVDIPYMKTVQLLVRFDDRPGQWMMHCHILDHAEGGLMTTVLVGGVSAKSHEHTQ